MFLFSAVHVKLNKKKKRSIILDFCSILKSILSSGLLMMLLLLLLLLLFDSPPRFNHAAAGAFLMKAPWTKSRKALGSYPPTEASSSNGSNA